MVDVFTRLCRIAIMLTDIATLLDLDIQVFNLIESHELFPS